jgi:hypothetical protein
MTDYPDAFDRWLYGAKAIEARSEATPKSGAARQGESAVAKRFAQKGSA